MLEGFDEVEIVNENNGFGLDVSEKTGGGFWSTTSDMRAVLQRKTGLGFECC